MLPGPAIGGKQKKTRFPGGALALNASFCCGSLADVFASLLTIVYRAVVGKGGDPERVIDRAKGFSELAERKLAAETTSSLEPSQDGSE